MSKPCGGKRPCCLCKSMADTYTFKSKRFDEAYKINNDYNCNSKMSIYLIECQVYGQQCIGSTKTKFWSRTNHYKSMHRKFMSKKGVPKQALKTKKILDHYFKDIHTSIEACVITLLDREDTVKELRKKELH